MRRRSVWQAYDAVAEREKSLASAETFTELAGAAAETRSPGRWVEETTLHGRAANLDALFDQVLGVRCRRPAVDWHFRPSQPTTTARARPRG